MSVRFSEYYFTKDSDLLIEKKTKTKININKLDRVIEIDERGRDEIIKTLSDDLEQGKPERRLTALKALGRAVGIKTEKPTKLSTKEKARREQFIKQVYEGILVGDTSKISKPYTSIDDISVYKTNKGGTIVILSLEGETNEEGSSNNMFYIGADKKGQEWFRTRTGQIFSAWTAMHKPGRVYRRRPRISKKYIDTSKKEKDTKKKTDISRKTPGIMTINNDDFERLKCFWGNGVEPGTSCKTTEYNLKGKLNRSVFEYEEVKEGYEYKLVKYKGNVYLLKFQDGANWVIFDSPETYDFANKIGMLGFWSSNADPFSKKNIEWSRKPQDIYDLLED